jgi:serine/threonine-protein kinase
MATVYLARDERHNRNVALKVLKPELADAVGADRFLAEIKTTANLQHPHLLPLFDSGEAEGFLYYVMPYVEGESLRDRLDREHQLPVDEAVRIATSVAEALDYAHSQGVIHRDIKPANILFQAGAPVIADFGIALAVEAVGGGRLTETGLSLGTPHYMSPEQAAGDRDVDHRSDVYSLGCVLYEMLAGRPPFAGSTARAVLVQILTTEPPSVSSTRPTAPAHIQRATAKALSKLPADRFSSAADFRSALANPGVDLAPYGGSAHRTGLGRPGPSPAPTGTWLRDPRSLASIGSIVALVAWSVLRGEEPTEGPVPVPLRTGVSGFEVRAAANSGLRLAIAPDGSQIVVSSEVGTGDDRLFIRSAGDRSFSEVPGTTGAGEPGFSPDGAWLVYEQLGQIYRREVAGGPAPVRVTAGNDPHWGLDSLLVYSGPQGLASISPFGGASRLIVPSEVAAGDRPWLLPDGEAIVFQGEGAEGARLMLAELPSGQVVDLGIDGSNPRYAASGHLVYGHPSQVLMAVPFDLARHRVAGAPTTVLPSVLVYAGGWTQFSVSNTGTAIYALGGPEVDLGLRFALVDENGEERPSPLPEGTYRMPRFSPDGRTILYDQADQIRVWDRVSGGDRTLARGGQTDFAIWSTDGQYVYFSSRRGGTAGRDVFRVSASGSDEPVQLFQRAGDQIPVSASPDGSRLLLNDFSQEGGLDLLMLVQGSSSDATIEDFLVGPWNELMAAISPDGERVAYVSDESGTPEVYVRAFPSAERPVRLSDGGGGHPVWAPDSRAVYYLDLEGEAVWRVALESTMRERAFATGPGWRRDSADWPVTNWDVHPDGREFVVVQAREDPDRDGDVPVLQVEIVTNWFTELRAQFGSGSN